MPMLDRIDRLVVLVTSAAIIALLSAMTGSILLGVFFRYFLNDALIWTEELSRYAMIWLSFLGASLAFRRGGHIAVQFGLERMSPRIRSAVIFIGCLAVIFMLCVLAWKGWEMTNRVARQRSPAMSLSMFWPYLAIPVGSVLMIYHQAVLMLVPSRRPRPDEAAAFG